MAEQRYNGTETEPTLTLEHHEPGQEGNKILGHYFARFGTCMLTSEHKGPGPEELMQRLKCALEAEPRIQSVDRTEFKREWMARKVGYPSSGPAKHDRLLSGDDHFHYTKLSDPLLFTINVPIKNQPGFRGYNDIPTDTYYVSWNGVTLVTMWGRSQTEENAPRAGGHIVIDVLSQVAKKAGLTLYVQPCSPGCVHRYAHRVLRIEHASGSRDIRLEDRNHGTGTLDVQVRVEGGPIEVVGAIGQHMSLEGGYFAQLKNLTRRLQELEALAREYVGELLTLQYERNINRQHGPWRRLRLWWGTQRSTQRARHLIATLWLIFTRMESLRSEWFPIRDRFHDTTERKRTASYFSVDQKDDDRAISRQDLSYIQAAAEHSSTSVDARTIAFVTALTAAAGLLGALLGAVIS